MIFHFKAAQNLVAEHYERYSDMIFHFKAAQNLVAEHYERYSDMIFLFMPETCWFQSIMQEILTWLSTSRWNKILLQSIRK